MKGGYFQIGRRRKIKNNFWSYTTTGLLAFTKKEFIELNYITVSNKIPYILTYSFTLTGFLNTSYFMHKIFARLLLWLAKVLK